jgi:predicted kinase
MKSKSLKPKLFITMGYPGSGKTHFAERFSKQEKFVHLSSDFFRTHIFPTAKRTLEENKTIFGLIDSLAFHILKNNISVIIDANATMLIFRKGYAALAKKAGADCYTLYFKTPLAVAEKRIVTRVTNHPIKSKFYRPLSIAGLHELKNEMEEPYKNEKVISIDGLKKFEDSLKDLKKALKNYENIL